MIKYPDNVLVKHYGDLHYLITYVDSKFLYVNQTSLIINVATINRIGTIRWFAELYCIDHVITNGELMILTDEDPNKMLNEFAQDFLVPEGFDSIKDFVILWFKGSHSAEDFYRLRDIISIGFSDYRDISWLAVADCKSYYRVSRK